MINNLLYMNTRTCMFTQYIKECVQISHRFATFKEVGFYAYLFDYEH